MLELGALQDKIKDLFETEVFGDKSLFKTPQGDMVTITGFSQNLPVKTDDGEDARDDESYKDLAPYFILAIQNGDDDDRNEAQTIHWELVSVIYDNDKNNQGYKDSLHIVQTVINYLRKHRMLCGTAYIESDSPISFELPEGDTWPYFVSDITFETKIPSEGVEDVNI